MGFFNQLLELFLVGARYGNLEFDGETEVAVLLIQRDLAGHPRSLAVEAVFSRDQHDRLAVTGMNSPGRTAARDYVRRRCRRFPWARPLRAQARHCPASRGRCGRL